MGSLLARRAGPLLQCPCAYGIVSDNGPLEVLAFCGAMPTLLGFLVLLGMHMTWLD